MASAKRIPALDAALLEFGAQLDDSRQQLYYVDVAVLKKEARLVSRSVRANLYVQIAAAVEVFVGKVVRSLIEEISLAAIGARDLRISLFSMSSGGMFTALGEVRGLKNWDRRCDVLEALESSTPVTLDGSHLPLDGRTIRPEHLAAIHRVFGFKGSPLPGPVHGLALNDLADSRNDVAHGNEPVGRVAGRKSSADMVRFISRIEEIGLHIYNEAVSYLQEERYKRL